MKLLATILILMTSFSAFAGGGASSKEDVLFSLAIIAFLAVILGAVYLLEFINKVRKDKDYRNHLKLRVVHLISTVRAIFIRVKKVKDDRHMDYAVSLGL